jgi:hypothetical protein
MTEGWNLSESLVMVTNPVSSTICDEVHTTLVVTFSDGYLVLWTFEGDFINQISSNWQVRRFWLDQLT